MIPRGRVPLLPPPPPPPPRPRFSRDGTRYTSRWWWLNGNGVEVYPIYLYKFFIYQPPMDYWFDDSRVIIKSTGEGGGEGRGEEEKYHRDPLDLCILILIFVIHEMWRDTLEIRFINIWIFPPFVDNSHRWKRSVLISIFM